jgi:hypothetical protein
MEESSDASFVVVRGECELSIFNLRCLSRDTPYTFARNPALHPGKPGGDGEEGVSGL